MAEEIENEIVYRLLSVKVEAISLFSFQAFPNQDFRLGALVSQLSSKLLQLGVVWDDVSFHVSADSIVKMEPFYLNEEKETHP